MLTVEGFILRKEPFQEEYHHLELFSRQKGKLSCLRRFSQKSTQESLDLFDKINCNLKASQGTLYFVNSVDLIWRYEKIGEQYSALNYSSLWAKVLLKNLEYMESFENVYMLCEKAFASWERGVSSEATYFKALFLMLCYEGYPVREDWWKNLPSGDRQSVSEVLKQPLVDQVVAAEEVTSFIEQLARWVKGYTDIIL